MHKLLKHVGMKSDATPYDSPYFGFGSCSLRYLAECIKHRPTGMEYPVACMHL